MGQLAIISPKNVWDANLLPGAAKCLQRTVLGFAAPGNAYWTQETIDAVGQRYPGMDMTPYKKAQKS